MPSPLKSACTIEYMPLRPTLLPATEKIAGELNSGCCTGEEPAIGCDAGGDVGFEMVAGAAGPCTSRLLWFFGPAKPRFTNETDKNPKTKTKPHARMPAALTQNTFSPPLHFLF